MLEIWLCLGKKLAAKDFTKNCKTGTINFNENRKKAEIRLKETGTKIWIYIYKKPTDSKKYVPFASSHLQKRLENISFCLVRRIKNFHI